MLSLAKSAAGGSSLGMLETRGRLALIAATDAMAKAGGVSVLSTARPGKGQMTVFVRGDVASCQAACEAGAIAASNLDSLVAVHVIPQPHPQLKEHWPEIIESPANRGAGLPYRQAGRR